MSNPSSFQRCSLGSLASYVNGFAFKPGHLGTVGTPVVRIEQLNNPDGRFDKTTVTPPVGNHIESGDIIFSWSGTLKAARWKRGRAYLNQHLFKVTPKPGVHDEFLLQLLQYSMPELAQSAHGSTMKHIQRGELDRFFVSIPTEESEQRRIADLLSAVDEKIEGHRVRAAKLAATKTGVAHKLLHGAPSGAQYPSMPLSRLIARLESGVSVNAEDRAVVSSSDRGVLKTSCVVGGDFLAQENKTIWKSDISRARISPQRGCIIISRMNTPELVGECGLVDAEYPNLYLPDRLWQAVPASPETSFRWLNECLQWEPVRKRIKDAATGTSNSMKNISKGAFLAVEVPVPPPGVQQTIAGVLGALSKEMVAEIDAAKKLSQIKQGLAMSHLVAKT